ncbi:MAG: hypothetical protein Q9161_005928 [Pseudevernia consocians]
MSTQPALNISPHPTTLGLKVFGISVAVALLILMVLYVIYAGTRANTHGHNGRFINFRGGGARHTGDAETGSGTAGRNRPSLESVDTLPRYTPGDERVVAPLEQVHGRDEHDRVEGVGRKPPSYTFDAGGAVSGEAEHGNDSEWPRGEGHIGHPVTPDAVHVSG